jgi:hypothetical protein
MDDTTQRDDDALGGELVLRVYAALPVRQVAALAKVFEGDGWDYFLTASPEARYAIVRSKASA